MWMTMMMSVWCETNEIHIHHHPHLVTGVDAEHMGRLGAVRWGAALIATLVLWSRPPIATLQHLQRPNF